MRTTQIIERQWPVRLKQMPWLNHSWHVTLYVTANGLTTGSIPYAGGVFQVDFDFIHHSLHVITSAGVGKRSSFIRVASPIFTVNFLKN